MTTLLRLGLRGSCAACALSRAEAIRRKPCGVQLRFDDLRHSFGSLLAVAGVDVVTIQGATWMRDRPVSRDRSPPAGVKAG